MREMMMMKTKKKFKRRLILLNFCFGGVLSVKCCGLFPIFVTCDLIRLWKRVSGDQV